MDRERILKMDPILLLSWINTKLRDDFSSLDSLSDYYEVDKKDIITKLEAIDYIYNDTINQFRQHSI